MKRFTLRAGNYNNTSNAGPKYSNANNRRSNANAFGFVFIDSQLHGLYGDCARAFDKKSPTPASLEANNNRCVRPVGFARPPYCTNFIMKTYNNIWDEIISFENIYAAYRRAAKCKYYRPEVLQFTQNLEENLIEIQNQLIWNRYTPSPPRQFYVYEPKKRLITAPAFRDRIVHHAICAVIEPIIDRRFIYDSYACRTGKGNIAAVKRLQSFAQRAKSEYGEYYVFKGDIKSFFPSIQHDVLKRIIRRVISDIRVLEILDVFIDSSGYIGLPIGALLSQLLANLVLDALDHFVKEDNHYKYYLRYMDDFVIFTRSSLEAREAGEKVSAFVTDVLGLTMNPKSGVIKGACGIKFCGFRVWPSHILPAKPAFKRAVRRLKKMARLHNEGEIPLERARSSLMAFLGHYKHCNAARSIESALDKITFTGRRIT